MRLVPTLLTAGLLMLVGVFLVRGLQAFRGPPLEAWHREAPAEPTVAEIDAMDWAAWMAREAEVMAATRAIEANIPAAARVPSNRHWSQSPVNPARLATDWNYSRVLLPEGRPLGAAVLLHGMTDAPYSLRHFALLYREAGFAVVAVRLPGHGTVPAGLTQSGYDAWQAATRLAVREARRLVPQGPLHLVGYSNGAALAVRHGLAATANSTLAAPDRLLLVSPMIGLTPFARFAGVAGWPALLPAFANAAWLDIRPEFNPYKYNSFPVKAAVEAHALTEALGRDMDRAEREGRLQRLAPVLGFQSVVDFTVSTPAVMAGLYDRLPPGRADELVLFDINHAAQVGPLLRPSARTAVERLLPPRVRPYRVTLVTNDRPPVAEGAPRPSLMVVAKGVPAGAMAMTVSPVGITWDAGVHSLSHVALPFPVTDGLYGSAPDPADDQGLQLGVIASRGETATLIVGMEFLTRQSSNPFWPWVETKVAATWPGAPP